MAGKFDRGRDESFRGGVHTPTGTMGKSFMRVRSPATHSPKPGTAAASASHRVSVPASTRTPPTARAPLESRDPRKIPVAPNSAITTPSNYATPVPCPALKTTPGTMSRKLDGVHSLEALLEKQSQEASTLSQSRNKFARSSQSKVKNQKFDPRAADSDSDEESSSDDSSDDDGPSDPQFFAKINGQIAPAKPASSPLKKAKRGKNDEVADSDSERKASTTKPTPKKKAPIKPESSSEEESDSEPEASETSDSDSDSDSESEPSKKKPAQKATQKAAASNGSSTTSSSGSDSESDSEAEKPTKPAVKRAVNGTKSAEPASTSSSEASSSDEEEESSSEKEDSSDEEESDNEAANESVAVAKRRNSKDLSVPGFVGKDFVLRQAQGDEDGKDMADFFAKAKLDGKQLWYFTAPASIPISVVEKLQIPMDKAQSGDAMFQHNSEDYTVGFDVGSSTAVQLLIPNKKGTRYEQAPQKVDKILHVKRVTNLLGGEPRVKPTNSQGAARPQPPGLRARFHPIGVTDDTPMGKIGFDASSDSEEDVELATAPSAKKAKRAATQSQGDAMDIDEPTPKSSKKDKKRSKRKHPEDDEETASAQLAKETLSAEKKAKKVKRDTESSTLDAAGQASAKKVTAILPPTIPKAGFSFSSLPAGSSPAPQTSTPQPKTKSKGSKKSKTDEAAIPNSSQASARKETPIQPPSIRRESAVPLPLLQLKKPSTPTAAEETPKKEKRKRRKSDKTPDEEPKSDKKETPVPVPKI